MIVHYMIDYCYTNKSHILFITQFIYLSQQAGHNTLNTGTGLKIKLHAITEELLNLPELVNSLSTINK